MVDLAGGNFLVANEPREDREAGGVGARPPERAERIRTKVEPGTGTRRPPVAGLAGDVQLEQLARFALQRDHMTIATGGAGCSFDPRVEWHGERTRVALIAVRVVGAGCFRRSTGSSQ
jgi:hypothetical protein